LKNAAIKIIDHITPLRNKPYKYIFKKQKNASNSREIVYEIVYYDTMYEMKN